VEIVGATSLEAVDKEGELVALLGQAIRPQLGRQGGHCWAAVWDAVGNTFFVGTRATG
jgi:hypothetical protein